MMTSAFEAYDPSIFGSFSFYWPWFYLFFLFLFFLLEDSYSCPNAWGSGKNFLVEFMKGYYKNFRGGHMSGLKFLLGGVFLALLSTNGWGLMPFLFSCTSHGYWTLMVGLPIWLIYLVKSFWENYSFGFSYFLPSFSSVGTKPQYGMLLGLVFLEFISLLIQPVTLAIRLMANVGAGHLVLSLASSVMVIMSHYVPSVFMTFVIIFYVFFELAVNFLQAYIVFILLLSYSSTNVGLTVK